MKNQKLSIIAVIFIVVIIPVLYIRTLDVLFPIQEFKLSKGFVDNTFRTGYSDPSLFLEEFNVSEWTAVPIPGYTDNNTGFMAENQSLVLYAKFDGWGKRGIEIRRPIPKINTTVSPFMAVRFRADSLEEGLMFSFAVLDDEGNRYSSLGYHVSENWTYAEFDLRERINGTISCVAVRFTNDFDISIVGETQYLYIQEIGIYKHAPDWKTFCTVPIEESVSSENNVLTVFARGNISAGTIVTAQRSDNFSFSLQTYCYLNVSIKTSSINVSARIVVWTNSTVPCVVLLKTYNDENWHTEIVDLSSCGVTEDKLLMIELGLMQVYDVTNSESSVNYQELSFCKL
jgi:hypothetical protein